MTRTVSTLGIAALVASTLTAGALATSSAAADAAPAGSAVASSVGTSVGKGAAGSGAATADRQNYDARSGGTPAESSALSRKAASVSAGAAVTAYRASLGDQALVAIDGLTSTPRQVARLDGLLTGPSTATPAAVTLGYVRAHADVFRLTAADLAGLRLRQDYVDVDGIHHLSWVQYAGGTPVFGNGLQAAVTRTGALVSISGSPLAGLSAPAAVPAKAAATSATAAVGAARADLGERALAAGPRDTAAPVLFATSSGVRRAWQTVTMSAARPAVHVIDAESGRVLYRQSLTNDATAPAPHATGKAFGYYPGAAVGGQANTVDFTAHGWLPPTATVLSGNNSHAYSDVDDNNRPGASEEVHPTGGTAWNYVLKPINAPFSFCGAPLVCTWNPDVPFSWRANRAQNTTQVFTFVNRWHDHLRAAPIGFTEAAGNFQVVNGSGQGAGGDPVLTETEDGANTDHGLPDSNHIDNANMATPPDGHSPRMQMYLQHQPGTTYPDGDPFAPTDVGDEADTVYHEYTHGLSNRLVVDAAGVSTLLGDQAGGMGEAWSDWYAMDYLVAAGFQADTAAAGDVVLFQFDGAGVALDRTEPIDCPVGTTSARCPGTAGAGTGGYTYGDLGKVIGFPEVHSDGEIWAQTLWDLRAALGSTLTESLVTRAMELSPANPSFLDERNAILMADTAIYGGRDTKKIWTTFAARGMGWFAGALGGDDTTPAEDFSMPPPAHTPRASLTGRVVATGTGEGVAGAVVQFGGHASGFPGAYAAVADAAGRYAITGMFPGTYPKVSASAPGYDAKAIRLSLSSGANVRNLSVVRDLAAATGGATIRSFTGPDFTSSGCGPRQAIDQSLGSGWGSTSDLVDGELGPTSAKRLVIALPAAADIGTIAVDPNATCGDGGSASTAGYVVEFSGDGTTWRTAATGTFAPGDSGHLNRITPAAGTGAGVAFVRFTTTGPQVFERGFTCPESGASGCEFLDLSELELYAPGS